LICTDKFGRRSTAGTRQARSPRQALLCEATRSFSDWPPEEIAQRLTRNEPGTTEQEIRQALAALGSAAGDRQLRGRVVNALTLLADRQFDTRPFPRRVFLELVSDELRKVWQSLREHPSSDFLVRAFGDPPPAGSEGAALVLDGRGFPAEGPGSLAEAIRNGVERGYQRLLVAHARGHRFLACGLGPDTRGVRLDLYDSPGDYLASGLDGAEVYVHASGQDQLAQILKTGKLVVHGDVGQTFMYAAKGGSVFVLGNAAGRPLINAVGRPRVVINGTALDYLAESFMAGDPHRGGGFVIVNGLCFDLQGWVGAGTVSRGTCSPWRLAGRSSCATPTGWSVRTNSTGASSETWMQRIGS
jgi:hypothetical protein